MVCRLPNKGEVFVRRFSMKFWLWKKIGSRRTDRVGFLELSSFFSLKIIFRQNLPIVPNFWREEQNKLPFKSQDESCLLRVSSSNILPWQSGELKPIHDKNSPCFFLSADLVQKEAEKVTKAYSSGERQTLWVFFVVPRAVINEWLAFLMDGDKINLFAVLSCGHFNFPSDFRRTFIFYVKILVSK